MHVKEVHGEIEHLLDEIRATEGVFIRVESAAYLVGTPALEEALAGTALPGFLRPAERVRLDRRLVLVFPTPHDGHYNTVLLTRAGRTGSSLRGQRLSKDGAKCGRLRVG